MIRLLNIGLTVLAATMLAACQNSFQVSANVQQAVADNKNAINLMQWETSSAHPETLFAQWKQGVRSGAVSAKELGQEICKELSKLSPLELTVFETQITEDDNQDLLEACHTALVKKIDGFYKSQQNSVDASKNQKSAFNSFRFPDNVQLRDTTNGYYAWSGDVGPKEIVLTFDDGPSPEYTAQILTALKEVNAKAIFFNEGKNVFRNQSIVKTVLADGHAVGSHSMSHACLAANTLCQSKNGHLLTFDEAAAEIRGAHQAVFDAGGMVDPFFRFPYGESSPELKNFLKRNKVGEFNWNMDSEDWRATTNEQLLAKALSEIDRAGRGIILFHDIQRRTAEVMPQFLREIYNRGYSVVLLQSSDPAARLNSPLVQKPQKP